MPWPIALALFASTLALADGPGKTIVTGSGTVIPARGGPTAIICVIPDDANTVFHLCVKGGAVVDTIGHTITETGSLTRVGATSLGFPNGKTAEGVNAFATNKYLTAPSGIFNYTNDYIITAIVKTGASGGAATQPIISGVSGTNGGSNATGMEVVLNDQGSNQYIPNLNLYNGAGGIASPAPSPNPIDGTLPITILSFGQTGNTFFVKRDSTGASSGTASGVTQAAFSGTPRIGWQTVTQPSGGSYNPFTGTVFEIRVTRTIPSVAVLNALHSAAMN